MTRFRRFTLDAIAATLLVACGMAAAGGAQSPAASASHPAPAGIKATRAIVTLKTPISSKGESKGKEIKLLLAQAVALPDGTALPRGTALHGLVGQSSQHSKAKPNGALLLLIDEARPKDSEPIPLLVKIRALSPSASAEIDRTELPGARLGGSSNSGGTQQMMADQNDHTEIRHNVKDSGLKGVYLDSAASGSGLVYALDDDVYLDEGVALTLVVARRKPAP